MRYPPGHLTEMQAEFAKMYAQTRDYVYSASKAGYKQPITRGFELSKNPTVLARVQQEMHKNFERYAQDAPHVLASIMYDEKARNADRIKAASVLIDHSGYDAPGGADGKEAHEMTPSEIAEELDRLRVHTDALETIAAANARPIDAPAADLFG